MKSSLHLFLKRAHHSSPSRQLIPKMRNLGRTSLSVSLFSSPGCVSSLGLCCVSLSGEPLARETTRETHTRGDWLVLRGDQTLAWYSCLPGWCQWYGTLHSSSAPSGNPGAALIALMALALPHGSNLSLSLFSFWKCRSVRLLSQRVLD